MSKVLAGTAFVLLGGVTATGGVLLLNRGSKGEENKEQIDVELSDTLDKFKSTDKDRAGGCVKNLFGDVQKLTSETGNEIATSDIGSDSAALWGTEKKTEGCLVVNWDKKSKTESGSSKWNGTFRLLWAVKGEKKGFVVFLLGKTAKDGSGTNHKLNWEAAAYILEYKGSEGAKKWTEIKRASAKNNAAFANNESNLNKLPVPGNALKGTGSTATIPTFWGFFDAASKLNELADANQPTGTGVTQTSLKAYWKWDGKEASGTSGSSSPTPVKLLTWTDHFDTWWKEVFDESKFKVKDVLENQQGTWTQKVYGPSPDNTSGGTGS